MLWIVGGVVLCGFIGLAVVIARRPDRFAISRQTTIEALPAEVFAEVNDFHQWQAWSPWAKIDPACKYEYTGPTTGPGAGFGWSGNNKVGQGRMTITDVSDPRLIQIRLEFLRPFKATNQAEFKFTELAGKTLVTWTMSGANGFMQKAFGLFVDCDKMVGKDFEKGLASMKQVVESKAAVPA